MRVPGRLGRWIVTGVLAATPAVAVTACGSSSSSQSTSTSAAGSGTATGARSTSFGSPHPATGTPYVVGMLNMESGAVTFPGVREAAQAGINYLNQYRDGINGHPLQLANCVTDGTPSTSQSCANQIADKHPLLILGAADVGAAGAFPVWLRDNLAYVGGSPLSPVESNAPNAVIFMSITFADNGAMVSYAASKLGVKKASLISTNDTQGLFQTSVLKNEMQHVGIQAKVTPISTTQADLAGPAASAISGSPDLVYIQTPTGCPAALTALKSVGYTGKLAGIDPCSAPPAIASAGAASNGLYFAQPFYSLNSNNPDAQLARAIFAKWAPKDIALDTPTLAELGSVMNLQAALSKVKGPLNTKTILAAFRSGSNHPNFLGHPYTCDRMQVPAQTASCDAYQLIKQIQNKQIITVSGWVNGGKEYVPGAKP